MFAFLLGLDLCLLCTTGTPVRKMLDVWPPLPIEILDLSIDHQVGDEIIAALEHPNRVRSLSLHGIWTALGHLVRVAELQEPLPAMEYLFLQTYGEDLQVLPNTFLGGSTPCL
jgi:hypothetical protein